MLKKVQEREDEIRAMMEHILEEDLSDEELIEQFLGVWRQGVEDGATGFQMITRPVDVKKLH